MSLTSAYEQVFKSVVALPNNITVDLASRYAAAFGMRAAGNLISMFEASETQENNYNFQFYPESSGVADMVKLEIPGGAVLEFGNVLITNSSTILAPPMLMTFKQEKALIETNVNDDDTLVVERWGTNPWSIRMQGLLIDLQNRIYPSDEIRQLNRIWKHNGIIKAIGQQFEEKDIDSIYFKSIDFSPIEGFQDTIRFSLEARSIKAVNFTLLKPVRNFSVEVGDLTITSVEE